MKKSILLFMIIVFATVSCGKKTASVTNVETVDTQNELNNDDSKVINVTFSLGESVKYDNEVKEDASALKALKREHSVKYYAYHPSPESTIGNFTYYDVAGNKKIMTINENVPKNTYKWNDTEGVLSKKAPVGHKMSYGIDISRHNGDVDFIKVKDAGFDFVLVRIAYRGYGKQGRLVIDELQDQNLKLARNAGLKVGAYVFSQSINEEEAREEARLAIDLVKDYGLDLPLIFDPENVKAEIARTDNVEGDQFTNNAIAFCEEVKKAGFTPAIYSNMVWEDYYFDMEKLKDYEIWYADYSKIPQTPYNFKYWQFSEVGIVDGVKDFVDLNVMIE